MNEAVLRVRPATPADARRIWEWRNDEETRAASYTTAPIPYEAHRRWFASKLEDRAVRLLLAVDGDGQEVGYARLDVAGDAAELSLSIDRGRRGQRLGTALIRAATAFAFSELGVARVDARVKAGNPRSAAAFARAGFATVARRPIGGVDSLELSHVGEPTERRSGRFMNVTAIIQARMTSTRLPGKVLRPILGTPMLALLVERLQQARRLDGIVVASTSNATDDPVEALAAKLGVGCFRGSEDDVLDRVVRAAHAFNVDLIVEVTGDCPLIDPEVVDRLVDTFLASDVDYVANVLERTYPRGLDTQVFPTRVLDEVARLTQHPVDREHVSIYIYSHPERFRLLNVTSGLPAGATDLRLTVDTREDFTLITEIYEALYPANPRFRLADVLALFARRPELRDINREVQQKVVQR